MGGGTVAGYRLRNPKKNIRAAAFIADLAAAVEKDRQDR
jgi:hypothetical protein